MSRARYIHGRAGKAGKPHNAGVSVETLAVALRRAGAQRVHRDIALPRLEQQLERSGSVSELALFRRAWAMAQDSRQSQDGAKASHWARQRAILSAGQIKSPTNGKGKAAPRHSKPASIDPPRPLADTRQRFSESERNGSLPERHADFTHAKIQTRKRTDQGLAKTVTHSGTRMFPSDVDADKRYRDTIRPRQYVTEKIDNKR